MPDSEHVQIVKQGARAIAAWRQDHSKLRLNLSEADLAGRNLEFANLSGANLRASKLAGANLMCAKLWAADLRGAELSRAVLVEADLRTAQLTGADLSDAWLPDADLSGANLSGANLTRAFLWAAKLKNADVSDATFAGTQFLSTTLVDLDLSHVRELEASQHRGPSSIGVDTLVKSQGMIPAAFLRSCGVPDVLIDYLPTLVRAMEPIQFYSCFISHSTKDEEFCHRLYSRMRDEKLRVWYAPEQMKGGEKLYDQIDEAIRSYDKVLLVLSEDSMASDWVETEIRLARKREQAEKRRVLFPIRLVDFETIRNWKCFDSDTGRDLAVAVREYLIRDFSSWEDKNQFEAEFTCLMSDLRAEPGRREHDPPLGGGFVQSS